jgi:hypothetical protein
MRMQHVPLFATRPVLTAGKTSGDYSMYRFLNMNYELSYVTYIFMLNYICYLQSNVKVYNMTNTYGNFLVT